VRGLRFIEEQPVSGRVVDLRAGLVIGRDACDIVAPDPEVSRRHAVLEDGRFGLEISDAGSLNGTFLNGQRLEHPRTLHDGDVVQVGNTVWRVAEHELPPAVDAGATKAAAGPPPSRPGA